MTLTASESECLTRLASGDEIAFREVYDTYAEPLMDYAASRLGSLPAAEDIVQDLFVHLWKEREHLNVTVSLRAFLFAAVRYRVINYLRHNSMKDKYAKLASSFEARVTQEELLEVKQLEEKLLMAAKALPPRPAQVFHMSRYQHKTTREIAKELGLSEKTVKNQLTTALTHLRAVLGKLIFLLWW